MTILMFVTVSFAWDSNKNIEEYVMQFSTKKAKF